MRKVLKSLQSKNQELIHIVFVCTANCCRSPLAEILFEKMLIDKLGSKEALGKAKLFIDSAAMSYSLMRISENSMQVLVKEEAISENRCQAHLGKLIDEVHKPDLILVMAENHLEQIKLGHPQLIPVTHRLDDFVKADLGQGGFDIDDPIGCDYSEYQKMKNIVKKDLKLLMEEMEDVGFFKK